MEAVALLIFVSIVVVVWANRGGPRAIRRTISEAEAQRKFPSAQALEQVSDSPLRLATLRGRCWVEDGDTIYIGGCAIRLAGIDAPELDQPYGKRAKTALIRLCRDQEVTAVFSNEQTYAREVATCYLPDGRDLSAEMVKLGLALDWRKFSSGKYRSLEPPDARRKLWRVDAKHKGRYPPRAADAGS